MLPDAFRRLKPLYGSRIDRLWIEYQLADPESRRQIDELLTILSVRRLGIALGDDRIVLEPPPADVIGRGTYELGAVSYPGMTPFPFRVGRNECLRHVFILGPTGSGKSTLILGLLQQLLADHIPVAVFDFKRNYRVLLSTTREVLVVTVGRDTAPLALNALQPPPGVTPTEWVDALADIISTAYLLMQGARNVLKEALLEANREFGHEARLSDALAILRNTLASGRVGSRRYGWLESTYRSIEELTKGTFGKALNAKAPIALHELLERSVVFELQGLGDDQKRFFCVFVLQHILLYRKNHAAPREVLRHVLVFDEAQHVFPRDSYGTLSIPSRLAREVREYGEALITASQQADISESIIANSGIKLILRCDYPRDVEFASRLLQIEPRWIPKIPLGYGIARLPTRYYNPFLFTFSEQPLKNVSVPEAAVRERWEALCGSIPANSLTTAISAEERALLQDVREHPISTITQRYQRLGWNSKTGNERKDAVIRKMLTSFVPVPVPSGRVKILSLTTRGWAALGATPQHTWREGGIEHEYWRHTVAALFEECGWGVQREHSIGRESVDVFATRGAESVVVEIETGRSDIRQTITKCQAIGHRGIIVFVRSADRDAYATMLGNLRAFTTAELHTLRDHIR